MKQLFFIISFLVHCLPVNSQKFTLSDCINYAYTRRIELQKQNAAQHYHDKNYTYSKYAFLPSFGNQANFQFNDGKQNQLTQSNTIELTFEFVLFNGFQIFNALKQSKLLSDRNKTYIEKMRNDIRLEVSEIYFSLLLTQENREIIQNSIESAEKQIVTITESVKAGRTSSIDLMEMQAQIEKEYGNMIATNSQFLQNLTRLKKAMNYTEKDTIIISAISTEFLFPDVIEDSEKLFLSAILTLPEFRLAKQDSIFGDYDIKRVKGQYAPYVSLFGNLSSQYQKLSMFQNNNFLKQIEDNFVKAIGVSLVVPIYNRHQIKKQQLEKEQQLSDIVLNNRQLYGDIYFETERITNEVKQSRAKIQSLEKRLKYYQQIYAMRIEQYNHGVLSITELLIAENNARNAASELAYEKYNFLYNKTLIAFYCGK